VRSRSRNGDLNGEGKDLYHFRRRLNSKERGETFQNRYGERGKVSASRSLALEIGKKEVSISCTAPHHTKKSRRKWWSRG